MQSGKMDDFSSAMPSYNLPHRGVVMKKVLPIIIVCGVGIALCLLYIAFLCVKALRVHPPTKRKHEFEIEDDVLTIKLGKRNRKK